MRSSTSTGACTSAHRDPHKEEFPQEVFYDIGAVVYYLRIISWQIADFSVEKYREKLYAIHTLIQREGKLITHGHRILVEALKE